jgi:hypothetical protein
VVVRVLLNKKLKKNPLKSLKIDILSGHKKLRVHNYDVSSFKIPNIRRKCAYLFKPFLASLGLFTTLREKEAERLIVLPLVALLTFRPLNNIPVINPYHSNIILSLSLQYSISVWVYNRPLKGLIFLWFLSIGSPRWRLIHRKINLHALILYHSNRILTFFASILLQSITRIGSFFLSVVFQGFSLHWFRFS